MLRSGAPFLGHLRQRSALNAVAANIERARWIGRSPRGRGFPQMAMTAKVSSQADRGD